MGRLEKYARKPQEPRSNPVSTKLSDQEYKDFVDYIKQLGLKPAEAIRYLILEEIYGDQLTNDLSVTKKDQRAEDSQPAITKTIKKRSESKPKKTASIRRASNYLSKFKINGKWPCPICNDWYSSNHYNQRHAQKHEGLNSEDFLRKYEAEALQMVAAYKAANQNI